MAEQVGMKSGMHGSIEPLPKSRSLRATAHLLRGCASVHETIRVLAMTAAYGVGSSCHKLVKQAALKYRGYPRTFGRSGKFTAAGTQWANRERLDLHRVQKQANGDGGVGLVRGVPNV